VRRAKLTSNFLEKRGFRRLQPTERYSICHADNAVWVTGSKPYSLQRIDPTTNAVVAKIRLPGEACSGLAFGFGSVWIPICGKKPLLARVDSQTNRIIALLPIGPALPEGGIAATSDSIWLVTDKQGATLTRIDPASNTMRQKVAIPAGSFNPLASGNTVWITGFEKDVLTAVDATKGEVLASIPVGPKPRFLASGGGAIWTLNQGDGSVTRIDFDTMKASATIALGIPGHGGDLAYGANSVWATTMDLPITVIDGQTNKVQRQWVGQGGDALRYGFDSIWLTDYHRGLLWRIPIDAIQQP
jgi:virginiamycin B lyase